MISNKKVFNNKAVYRIESYKLGIEHVNNLEHSKNSKNWFSKYDNLKQIFEPLKPPRNHFENGQRGILSSFKSWGM